MHAGDDRVSGRSERAGATLRCTGKRGTLSFLVPHTLFHWMVSVRPVFTALVLTLGVRCGLRAQALPIRPLTKPDAEFPKPFSAIVGVRELKDGRVLISDPREAGVELLDFASGKAVKVGATGSGPNEYRRSARLIAIGDTTLMYDVANNRFFLIGGDGKPAGTIPGAGDVNMLRFMTTGDLSGHLYGRSLSRPSEGDAAPAFAMPLLRYTIATHAVDTVATLAAAKIDIARTNAGPLPSARMDEIPFAVNDAWAAFSNGRIALIRGKDYHVEFLLPTGTRVSGVPNRYVAIPVTDADKAAERELRKPRTLPTGAMIPQGAEPSEWPATKAPFSGHDAWAAGNGEIWLEVARVAGDPAARFDVLDARGVRRSTVTLPKGSKLVGFGAHAVYVIRTDADDQQFLQRFSLGT